MKKYLIIDKNTMSRESISSLIYQIEEQSVVHEAEGLEDANSINNYYESIDTIIFNPGDRKENQINNLKTLKDSIEDSGILIITNCTAYDHIESLLRAGATSVISINSGRSELITAIRSVNLGQSYVSQNLLIPNNNNANQSNDNNSRATVNSKTQSITAKLTKRQKQVLDYIIKGYANKLIAYELGVSEGTVKLHVSSILRALKVTNRTEAAMCAGQTLNSHAHYV